MTGSAPVLLIVAMIGCLAASFYNWGGPRPAPGQPFWSGRLWFHPGWLGLAFMIAWMIWK